MRIYKYFQWLLVISIYWLTLSISALAAKPTVVVSIKPIEGLVLAIAGDTVTTERLLPDYTSLHHYSFRPSDIRKIKAADIIFHIDNNIEQFLTPLLHQLDREKIIALSKADNIQLLPITPSFKKTDNLRKPFTQNKSEVINPHNTDYHIWMSPQNGIAMAEKIVLILSKIQPQHTLIYQQNLKNLREKLNTFTRTFRIKAKAVQNKPYLVFHDSWQYFANEFQLRKLATVNLNADVQPGIKTILNTRQRIMRLQTGCLFSEPNFRPRTIKVLLEGSNTKSVEIDSLASHLSTSSDLYLNLMYDTAERIENCLS